jgi:hypothetical protein
MVCGAFCKLQKTMPRFGEREAWSPTRHTTPPTHANCGANVHRYERDATSENLVRESVCICEKHGEISVDDVIPSTTECLSGPKRCVR